MLPGHSSLSSLDKSWRRPGAQEGLVGKQQLDEWCTLLVEHCLQVGWSQEKPESASGIGGVTQPIGVVYVPVGLAGCNGSPTSAACVVKGGHCKLAWI